METQRTGVQPRAATGCIVQPVAAKIFTSPMKRSRITANLPGRLEEIVRRQAKTERYPSQSDYGIGLVLWDVYSRQPHALTGPLLREPAWMVSSFVEDLLDELGEPPRPPGEIVPYRLAVSVPVDLMPLVRLRTKEERYRSVSAYVSGLVTYDLKRRAPDPKKVPHHKTAPLLREPDIIRNAVFAQLARDFGKPKRKWPKGIEGRIDELIAAEKEKP